MPLVLYQTNEFANPRFHCDICDRYIEDASKGLVLWNWDWKREDPPVTIIPKIVCKDCDRFGVLGYPLSMELDVAVAYLLKNCGITTEARLTEICRRAALLSSIR